MIVSSGEFYQDIRFGLAAYNSGGSSVVSFLSGIYGFFLKPGGRRQQKVERVVILPSDDKSNLTVMQGEQINFTAIGLIKDQPQSGLTFNWSVNQINRNNEANQRSQSQGKPLTNGVFKAERPGIFVIAAEGGGVQSQVTVTVQPNEGIGVQKLLQKSETEKNEKEKQGLNKMLGENKLIAREISSKNNYNPEEEKQRGEVFTQKRNEVKTKQEQQRNRKPNPLQPTAAVETDEVKPEGVDRADAEGTVDEERLAKINRGPSAETEAPELKEETKSAAKSIKETKVIEETKTNETATPAPYRPYDEDGWNDGNWWMPDDPGNGVGNPPGTSPDLGAGNGNFQFSAPVAALPGRGMDINLSLSYNSRLWSKAGNQMIFDADKGNPAPGWNLGFGKMIYLGSNGGCMLVDADGTRRGYTGSNSTYSYGSYFSNNFTGHTADGSFIDYNCYYSSSSYGTYLSGSARLPNGTTVYYSSQSLANDQVYPTQIADAQGNYITITYQNNRGPNITTVTDTMGRIITFNYDGSNRLISVTVPGFNNGPARTAVQLHYAALTLNPGFAGGMTTDTNNNTPYVLDAIYYPGTNTGYWFGDGDSYSSYGMIAKVKEMRAMTSTGTTNDQGSVTAGNMSKQAVYSYDLTPNYSLTDAPTYANLTESWAEMDTAPAVTNYQAFMNSNPRTITVTQPNGVKSKQYMYNNPGVWNDGLIYLDETLDGSNNILSKSEVTWQPGNYDSARPIETKVTDERQQTLRTELAYGTNVYNQVTSKKEFDYNNGPLLRETRSTYESNWVYTSYRHIFNLVKSNEVFDGAGVRVAKTDYEYDNNIVVTGAGNHNLKATPGVTMHFSTHDPFTTETQQGNCINGSWNYQECQWEGQIVYVGNIRNGRISVISPVMNMNTQPFILITRIFAAM
ncbi:MAG: hypothetical protein HC846_08400 [Blastocatellia bacterium]|nr:hypothetical protein [Blastocatellia bacterium]